MKLNVIHFLLLNLLSTIIFCGVELTGSISPHYNLYKVKDRDSFGHGYILKGNETFIVNNDLSNLSLSVSQEIKNDDFIFEIDNIEFNIIPIDRLFLTFGKGEVFEGVAYAWNPVDIFNINNSKVFDSNNNSYNLQNPLYFSTSYFSMINLLSLELSANAFFNEKIDEMIYSAQLKFNIYDIDFLILHAFGFEVNDTTAAYIRFSPGFFPYFVLYGEAQYIYDDLEYKTIGGLQVNPDIQLLDGEMQLQAEYYYNSNPTKSSYYPGDFNNQYLYAGFIYLDAIFSCSAGSMVNIDNEFEQLINYSLEYRIRDGIKVYVNGFIPLGSNNSEFKKINPNDFKINIGTEMYFDFFDQSSSF